MLHPNLMIAAVMAVGLAGCASAPKQACTAEWIEYEVNDVYSDLRQDTRSELNSFKKIAAALENPEKAASPWLALRLVTLAKDVEEVVETYVETYQPRLQMIADTCDEPELVVDALSDFLEQEGVPGEVMILLREFSVLSRRKPIGQPPPDLKNPK